MGAFRVQQSLLLSSLLVAVFQPRIMLAAVGNRYTGRFLVKLSFFSSFRHLILTDLFLILPPRLVSYVFCLLSFVFCLCSLLFALCSLLFALSTHQTAHNQTHLQFWPDKTLRFLRPPQQPGSILRDLLRANRIRIGQCSIPLPFDR